MLYWKFFCRHFAKLHQNIKMHFEISKLRMLGQLQLTNRFKMLESDGAWKQIEIFALPGETWSVQATKMFY